MAIGESQERGSQRFHWMKIAIRELRAREWTDEHRTWAASQQPNAKKYLKHWMNREALV